MGKQVTCWDDVLMGFYDDACMHEWLMLGCSGCMNDCDAERWCWGCVGSSSLFWEVLSRRMMFTYHYSNPCTSGYEDEGMRKSSGSSYHWWQCMILTEDL